MQGNGSSKYLNTGLNQDDIADPPLTGHLSVYDMGFVVTGTSIPIGSYTLTTAAQRYSIERRTTAGRFGGWGEGGIYAGDAVNPATGAHLLVTRRSATDLEMYANAVSTGTNGSTVVAADSGNSFSVFAVNRGDLFSSHYAGRLSGYSAGLDMTAGQISSFYTAMQAFQTALGRNV